MKSEPDVFSIQDLAKAGSTLWEGVRNYQARNFMSQSMSIGDLAFFYHSNAEPAGIVGLMKVAGPAVPDPTQFQKKSEYFDKKANPQNPRWFCVSLNFEAQAERILSLAEIKAHPILKLMEVAKNGQRLSIMPVIPEHAQLILRDYF